MKLKELPLDVKKDAKELIRLSIEETNNQEEALYRHYEVVVGEAEKSLLKRGYSFTWWLAHETSETGPRFWPID